MSNVINKNVIPTNGNIDKDISVKDTIIDILKDLWVGTFGRETSSENVINIQRAVLSDIKNHQKLIEELNSLNQDRIATNAGITIKLDKKNNKISFIRTKE